MVEDVAAAGHNLLGGQAAMACHKYLSKIAKVRAGAPFVLIYCHCYGQKF